MIEDHCSAELFNRCDRHFHRSSFCDMTFEQLDVMHLLVCAQLRPSCSLTYRSHADNGSVSRLRSVIID